MRTSHEMHYQTMRSYIYVCTLNNDVIDMDMFERFEKKPWEKGRKSGPDVGYLGEYVIAVSAVLSGSWNSV